MFRKDNILLYAIVFAVGAAIIAAASAYGGELIPNRAPVGSSAYDASGFYVEVFLWIVTLTSGAMLTISLILRRGS
jgi:hypothetical protein